MHYQPSSACLPSSSTIFKYRSLFSPSTAARAITAPPSEASLLLFKTSKSYAVISRLDKNCRDVFISENNIVECREHVDRRLTTTIRRYYWEFRNVVRRRFFERDAEHTHIAGGSDDAALMIFWWVDQRQASIIHDSNNKYIGLETRLVILT